MSESATKTAAKAASTAAKTLSDPHSTKAEKSVAASRLAQRSSGKVSEGDSIFKIVSLGKSGLPGGLSRKKH